MAPKLPEGRPKFQPGVEERRRQLTLAREQCRSKGYEAEINIEIHLSQLALVKGDDDEARVRRSDLEAKIADFEDTRDNAYAGAHTADGMLMKLPKSKEAKKKESEK